MYIGIDPSLTGTGLIIINDTLEIVHQELISTKAKVQIEKRINHIFNTVINKIDIKNDVVYIEALSFGSSGQSHLDLAGLHFVITTFLDRENYDWKEIAPGTLKKFATGNGRCKKNLILKEVYKRFNQDFDDDNLADAYCLARMAYKENKK